MDQRDWDARLGRVEAAVRRWRWLSLAAFLGGGVAGLLGAAGPGPSGVVRARGFVVVDDRGRERIALLESPGGSYGIGCRWPDGRAGIALGITATGQPTLAVSDAEGNARIAINAREDGTPVLAFRDARERPRLTIASEADGHPALELADAEGHVRAQLGLAEGGDCGLSFRDRRERVRWVAGTNPAGDPSLLLRDPAGADRVLASVGGPNVSASVQLNDGAGTPRANLAVSDRNGPILELLDARERVTHQIPPRR